MIPEEVEMKPEGLATAKSGVDTQLGQADGQLLPALQAHNSCDNSERGGRMSDGLGMNAVARKGSSPSHVLS